MKRLLKVGLGITLSLSLLAGCGANNGNESAQNGDSPSGEIVVITREQGSGTRGAFVELTGIEKDDQDNTTEEAIVQNKTDGVLTSVAGDESSIGYISLGSVNDTIKTLKIDEVDATSENVKSGDYKISRPFNIVFKEDELSDIGKDFNNYIMSKQGQEIVASSYISVSDDAPEYTPSDISGDLTIAGSSSVTPIMEKLVEDYMTLNPNAKIAVQQSDSSAGIQAVTEGIAGIGMVSRDLKDSEKEEVSELKIALDGIAVIVNKNNSVDNMSLDNLAKIYTGEYLDWEEIQ